MNAHARTETHRGQFANCLMSLVTVGGTCLAATSASAVALISTDGGPPTDLVNQPQNHWAWDQDVITWKMEAEFLSAFPLQVQQDQVRLAFQEWETASSSQIRRDSLRYGWVRYNGQQDFYDMRSVLTHEIGHTLGSQHPDASWTNNDYMRNFRRNAQGNWFAAAPLGGEIMNEGNPPEGANGLAPGEYWRIVSKDELAFLDFSYNRHLDFVEVFGDDPADILVHTFNEGGLPSSSLGAAGPDGGPYNDPNDHSQGRVITAATITINALPNFPLGISARAAGWEYTNQTGQAVTEMSIRTRGTNNRNPISRTSDGAHRFTDNFTSPTTSFDLEDVAHRFSEPVGGSLPSGQTVQVGLQQDVWDWTVASANVRTSGGDILPASLLAAYDVVLNEPEIAPPLPPPPGVEGLEGKPVSTVIAQGFRIVNSDAPTTLDTLAVADLEGMSLAPDDLNSQTWNQLQLSGRVHTLNLIDPIELGPGEQVVVLLSGERADLPPAITPIRASLYFDLSDLADHQLLVYAQSHTSDSSVAAFSVINSGVYVPEPSSVILAASGLMLLVGRLILRRSR